MMQGSSSSKRNTRGKKGKEEKERPDDMATGSSPKSSCRKPEISCDRATRLLLGWRRGARITTENEKV
jgi:hypothetical protein